MPEWYPAGGDAFNIIQPCKNLIVRLPSDNYKIVDLKPKSVINLGKFGQFHADQLIGKPFGSSWEILPNKDLKVLERQADAEDEDLVLRDNRDVFDDKTAQLLTNDEIRQARATMSSKDLISAISSNNVNFDKKSVFSQEKYLRSKEQRFLKAFTPIQPSVGNVCDFLWSDKRERCMDLSEESIALMLSLANVCAGGRYLLIDETGLLVAAVLERGASVFLLHENQEPYLDTLKFFPHLQQHFSSDPSETDLTSTGPTFHSMDFLAAFKPGSITLTPPKKEGGPLYERKLRTYNREIQIHNIWNQGCFDGFLSVSSFDPQSFLPKVLNKIELSGNIAVYSPFREPIVEVQNYFMTKTPSRPILAPTVHEIRAPRWSTLKGRVRPDMTGRGGGGWIMSGIRVEESEMEPLQEKAEKKRKVEENGTEMEDVKMTDA